MKKSIVLLALLVLVVSCGSNSGTPSFENPREGTKGIVFEFLDNSPPDEIYEASALPIAIEMENQGATDVFEGYLNWIAPRSLFEGETSLNFFELYGKSLNNPVGQKQTYYQYLETSTLPTLQEVQSATIGAKICYPYETYFAGEVCINNNQYKQNAFDSICEVQDLSSAGQGAPVVIERVEVSMIPTGDSEVKPKFLIHVRNAGKGIVLNRFFVDTACSANSDPELFNRINIDEARLSENLFLHCNGLQTSDTGKAYAILEENQKTQFVCELRDGIPSQEAFTTPLVIKLSYGYTETITKEVDIYSSKVIR